MYIVCANATSDPNSSPASYGSINSGGCPFPGTSGVTSFTDETTPSMKSWAGANTNKPITQIAENSTTKTVTFQFMGNTPPAETHNLPFTENFNNTALPADWSSDNVGTGMTESWSVSSTKNAGGTANEMKCKWQKINPATTRLITPAINTVGANMVKLSFKHMLDAYATGVVLKVQTSNDKINWTDANWSVNTTSTNINASTVEVDINTHVNSETTYFAFVAEGNLYQIDFWYIDNVSITATSTAPVTPVVSTANATSVTLNSAVCGGNVEFANQSAIIERGVCYHIATNPTITNSKIVAGTGIGNFTANLTNLSANTQYYVKAYATTSTATYYGNEITFKTGSQSVSYCESKGGNSSYEWIDLVKFAGINRVSGDDGGYKDMTSMKASVAKGSTYPIEISAGFSGTAYKEYWAVWIDFNQNGIFEDNEKVVNGYSSSSATLTGNIAIPADAKAGTTRMRVSMKYNSAQTACEAFGYGEVEDYAVEVTGATSVYHAAANDLSVEKTIKVYPNPAVDILNISVPDSKVKQNAYITDVNGKIIKQFVIENSESLINISDLNKGVYLLKIADKEEPIITKFIKL